MKKESKNKNRLNRELKPEKTSEGRDVIEFEPRLKKQWVNNNDRKVTKEVF